MSTDAILEDIAEWADNIRLRFNPPEPVLDVCTYYVDEPEYSDITRLLNMGGAPLMYDGIKIGTDARHVGLHGPLSVTKGIVVNSLAESREHECCSRGGRL